MYRFHMYPKAGATCKFLENDFLSVFYPFLGEGKIKSHNLKCSMCCNVKLHIKSKWMDSLMNYVLKIYKTCHEGFPTYCL